MPKFDSDFFADPPFERVRREKPDPSLLTRGQERLERSWLEGHDIAHGVKLSADTDKLVLDVGKNPKSRLGNSRTVSRFASTVGYDVDQVGTPASVVETDLASITMPANTMTDSVTGRTVWIRAWGTTAANNNTKTIRLYFGSTVIMSNNATTAPNNTVWSFEGYVSRTGTSTQKSIATGIMNATAQTTTKTSPTATETGTIVVKVTGTNGTAQANEIVCEGLVIGILN